MPMAPKPQNKDNPIMSALSGVGKGLLAMTGIGIPALVAMEAHKRGERQDAADAALQARVGARMTALDALRSRLEKGMHPEAAFLDAYRAGDLAQAVAT